MTMATRALASMGPAPAAVREIAKRSWPITCTAKPAMAVQKPAEIHPKRITKSAMIANSRGTVAL